MDKIKLRTLQQCAIENVMARTSDANKTAMNTRVERFNDLHIAAFMDIEKTTDSLQHVLEYKKELAIEMLNCSNKEKLVHYTEALKHAEDLIKKVLGMWL